MIYTVGYDHMQVERLVALVNHLRVDKLIDCRSVPQSRRPGFGGQQLRQRFPKVYHWAGASLGGRGDGPTAAGLLWLLAEFGMDDSPVCLLLCKEEAPGSCHRHFAIAVPMWEKCNVDCRHVMEDQVILASELIRTWDLAEEPTPLRILPPL